MEGASEIDGVLDGLGDGIGLSVGVSLGLNEAVGMLVLVGPSVGPGLGAGDPVGNPDGTKLWLGVIRVGTIDGLGLGTGLSVGVSVGEKVDDGITVVVGFEDGEGLGCTVLVGADVGTAEGVDDGLDCVGLVDGITVGGMSVGAAVLIDGTPDGKFVMANSGLARANGCSVGIGTGVGSGLASCGAVVGSTAEEVHPQPALVVSAGRMAQRFVLMYPKVAAISRLPQVNGD